jgi:hypothetical protein
MGDGVPITPSTGREVFHKIDTYGGIETGEARWI